MQDKQSGVLYLVGTPIGNLGDMTFRGLETLKAVDAIACEDTRHSYGLLNYYQIKKPLFACHKFNERESARKIADMLAQGKSVALITDAGMPAISDPGAIVVDLVRQSGGAVQVVPAASAVTSAMALSGICKPVWTFIGFLPEKKKERKALLQAFADVPSALVFYSSPYDVNKDLADLYAALGDRGVHVVKELTKLHERHAYFALKDAQIEAPKGEYVLIVEHPIEQTIDAPDDYRAQAQALMARGVDKKDAIKQAAKICGVPKDTVYKALMQTEDNDATGEDE